MGALRSSRKPIDLAAVRRVLAVKLSSFGDIVHVTPCLRALRNAFPTADIQVVLDRTWAPLLREDPHINGIIEADPMRHGFLSSWIDARRRIRARRGPAFDLAIDFQGLRRSAAWIYASRARWQMGRGVRRPGWQFAVRPDLKQHAVRVCAQIAEHLGIVVPDLEPRLYTSAEADYTIEQALRAAGAPPRDFVLANPFGTWRSKMWPVERWAALIGRIHDELALPVVIAGGPGEEADAAQLARCLSPPVPSLAGTTTLDQVLCLYRRAALAIGVDSGPMHAAAAVGTPVVALFGPTWPERTGPWGARHQVIQLSRAPSPDAYRDNGSRCHMEAIDVGTVLGAVAALQDQVRPDATRASVASIRGT
ncbi:MAG: rfaC [Deltaproteobacteria bacterium]|nr:rfaC [Deltaproteobacteria bacterium]